MDYFIIDKNKALSMEIWGFQRLRDYSVKENTEEKNFKYFSQVYCNQVNNREKFKAITVMHWDELVGIAVCDWVRRPLDFGRYQLSFVDVKKEERGKGIGTYIAKILNNAWFLKREILERRSFAPEMKSIDETIDFDNDPSFSYQRVLDRELKAEEYSIILPGYKGKAPKRHGIYNANGERMKWSKEHRCLVPCSK